MLFLCLEQSLLPLIFDLLQYSCMFFFCLSQYIFSLFLNFSEAKFTLLLRQLKRLLARFLALYATKGYYFDQLSFQLFKLGGIVRYGV